MKTSLYIHIPFCDSKCAYCDFYSFKGSDGLMEDYCNSVNTFLLSVDKRFDTAYIGGGTPTVLNEQQLFSIAQKAGKKLNYNAEFTCEANPARYLNEKMRLLRSAGVNRISMGLQSANQSELRALSRIHTLEDVNEAIKAVKKAGIDNFSLDLMLGLPGQTVKSLDKSIDFVLNTGAKHVSAYMLKIEKGTPFFKNPPILPDDDAVCEMYLHTVERLEKEGLCQYEISNFAIPGFESKHNLNYWDCGEYLGVGPAAHSFTDGKRFYFDRDINGFINNIGPIFDGEGGGFEEYAMLRLRLTEGLKKCDCVKRFKNGEELFLSCLKRAEKFKNTPLVKVSEDIIRLTPEGFLVSNSIIGEIV